MKLARMLTGWSGEYFDGMPGIVNVSNESYDALLSSEQAEPLCTLNSTVAAAAMAEAAVRLDVELTTDDPELGNFLKTYGAVVHVKKAKR